MAIVKSFRAEHSLSIEIKGKWFRFGAAIEVEPEHGENMEEVKNKAWNTVILEVEKQIDDCMNHVGLS